QQSIGRAAYRFRVDRPGPAGAEGEHEDTVAQFVLIEHPLPLGGRYAYVPRGPVIDATFPERTPGHVATCVETLREAMRRSGAVFARVEWPWPSSQAVVSREDAVRFGFRPARDVQPSHTTIVDLRKSEEALLAAMHQKTRYNIRLAEKHGVT